MYQSTVHIDICCCKSPRQPPLIVEIYIKPCILPNQDKDKRVIACVTDSVCIDTHRSNSLSRIDLRASEKRHYRSFFLCRQFSSSPFPCRFLSHRISLIHLYSFPHNIQQSVYYFLSSWLTFSFNFALTPRSAQTLLLSLRVAPSSRFNGCSL